MLTQQQINALENAARLGVSPRRAAAIIGTKPNNAEKELNDVAKQLQPDTPHPLPWKQWAAQQHAIYQTARNTRKAVANE